MPMMVLKSKSACERPASFHTALEGGYLASARLAKVHWQTGDRPLAPPRASVAGESALWVDPAEVPADADVAGLGHALAAGRHGDRDELMASTAAYSGAAVG